MAKGFKPNPKTKTGWKRENPKQIIVRVFEPRKNPTTLRHHTKPGLKFTEKGIDEMLWVIAGNVEKRNPGYDFKMVEVAAPAGTRQFNFAKA